MGLFSKSISDYDWLRQVVPLYEAARPLAVALSEAIRTENVQEQIQAVHEVVQKFPVIQDAVKGLPDPTSMEARQANKNLELALKDYSEGAKQGAKLFRDLAGGLGERLSSGGFSTRAAAGRVAFQKTMFEEIVKKAESRMHQASDFISRR